MLLMIAFSIHAQQNYYVVGNALNIRSEANTSSTIIGKLQKYDNLKVIQIENGWASLKYKGEKGYVSKDYIKKGRTEVVTTTGGRTGAICRDGTRSSATGRGACSHHGGVAQWTYDEVESVQIFYE